MAYSFLNDVDDIRNFYINGGSYFGTFLPQMAAQLPLANNPALQSNIAQAVSQRSASFSFLLRRMVPVMLCAAWENFREELEANEPSKYATHFAVITKWHNEPIREVSLLRHCIVHKNGKIDSEYMRKSRLKTFSAIGTVIDFTDVELDLQFKTFEDAYARII